MIRISKVYTKKRWDNDWSRVYRDRICENGQWVYAIWVRMDWIDMDYRENRWLRVL